MVTIEFIEQVSPIDPRLGLRAELRDDKGARFWTAFGDDKTTLFERAAGWLDDCHGRCGHTPSIAVAGDARPEQWAAAEYRVQQRQVARIGGL